MILLLALPLFPETGQQLAQQMRQTQLFRSEPIRGSLQTKTRRGDRISQTILFRPNVNGNPNHSEFIVSNHGNVFHPTIRGRRQSSHYSRLTILRDGRQSSPYLLSNNSSQLGKPLFPQEVMSSFARSDFWPADLGLEFFYWPHQKILSNVRIKMRKGVACRVLESRKQTAVDFGYCLVRSWISREHFGLVYAEAYNSAGKRIKTFEVSDVQKIDGQWKVSELRIRDEVAKSTTKLIFHQP